MLMPEELCCSVPLCPFSLELNIAMMAVNFSEFQHNLIKKKKQAYFRSLICQAGLFVLKQFAVLKMTHHIKPCSKQATLHIFEIKKN